MGVAKMQEPPIPSRLNHAHRDDRRSEISWSD